MPSDGVIEHHDRVRGCVLARGDEVPDPVGFLAQTIVAQPFTIVRPGVSGERNAKRVVDAGMWILPWLEPDAAI